MELDSEDRRATELPERRTISGFWRRILAFALDSVFLGLVGMAIGLLFYDPLCRLGGWGRLLGFCIALAYYGLLNSIVGKGQTIGKRIVKIEVINRKGENISPLLSVLRYTILAVPFFLNGAIIPPSIIASPFGHLLGLLVFGFGGAIIYLYIFNRRTRQSLHDVACGTFVVRTFPKGDVLSGPVWRPHVVVVGVWFVLVIVAMVVVQGVSQKGVFPGLLATQQAIMSSGKVHMATLSVGKTWRASGGSRTETNHLSSNVIWKKRPADYEAAATEVAAIILDSYPDVTTKDVLAVTVTYRDFREL